MSSEVEDVPAVAQKAMLFLLRYHRGTSDTLCWPGKLVPTFYLNSLHKHKKSSNSIHNSCVINYVKISREHPLYLDSEIRDISFAAVDIF